MKQQTFEASRQASWRRFEHAISSARQGYRLVDTDAGSFVTDYQQVARDLSVAKSRGYSRRLVAYLNDLVVRGHNLVYARRSGFLAAALGFLTGGFPRCVRAAWPYVLASAALFVVSLVAMTSTVLQAPEWIYSVMSADQAASFEAMYDPGASVVGRERESDGDFSMFGFYVMNNVGISFRVFASGLLFGLGSAFYLVSNGVYIGAAAGHVINLGYSETFFSFVAGHGSFELTGIVLCGGAGLMIGHSLISPGRRTRLESLQISARAAIRVVLGAALMLVIAAFIEAFWSSTKEIAPWIKYTVGLALWVVVIVYLAGAGRKRAASGDF